MKFCTRFLLGGLVGATIGIVILFNNEHFTTNMLKVNVPCFQEQSHLDALVTLVHSVDHLLTQYNVTHWLNYGTLIGAVRRQGIIPWDHDADIAYLYSDIVNLRAFADSTALAALNISVDRTICDAAYHFKLYRGEAYLDLHPFDTWENAQKLQELSKNKQNYQNNNSKKPNYVNINYHNGINKNNNEVNNVNNNNNNNKASSCGREIPNYRKRALELRGPREANAIVRLEPPEDKFFSLFGCSTHMAHADIFPIRPCQFSGRAVACPARPQRVIDTFYCYTSWVKLSIPYKLNCYFNRDGIKKILVDKGLAKN